MSNLQKFNETLEEFSQEVHHLKNTSFFYDQIQSQIAKCNVLIEEFEENSNNLTQTIQVQTDVCQNLLEIKQAHQKNMADLEDFIKSQMDLVAKQNKAFYTDIETTIKSKLDDNTSQISRLIEHERANIKQIIEIEFAKNTKELNQTILQLIKHQKITFVCLIIFSVAILLSIFFAFMITQ